MVRCLIATGAAVFSLSGVASAQTTLTKMLEISSMKHVGGGDADVHSKKGRVTHVSVTTRSLTIDPDKKNVRFTLVYTIKEGSKNHTHLEWSGEVVLPAPKGKLIAAAGEGTKNVSFGFTYGGEDHNWHNETKKVAGTYLTRLEIKFDGKGDDHNGNARLKADIAIPVTLVPAGNK